MTNTLRAVRPVGTRYVRFSAQGDTSDPRTPSEAYNGMQEKWRLVTDLLGGTDAMRAAGETWLPRETKETPKNYKVRLHRSFLYNGYSGTIDRLAAKPFSKPVTLPELTDEQLMRIEDDADGMGSSLTSLGRRLFVDGLVYGKAHVLVDYPVTAGQETPSLADERAVGLHPVLLHVSPADVIGWRSEKVNGREELTQVRIRERRDETVGKYGSRCVEYVRVVNAPVGGAPGTWELFRCDDKSPAELAPVLVGTHSYPGVPLLTTYFKRTGYMTSEPPLQDLAEMNLCHWQSNSDHRNYLRFCRFGMLKVTGISHEEYEKPLEIAPQFSFKSVSPDADMGYVETTGAAAKVGENDLKRIEERMETLGLQPLVETTADSTAIGKRLDEGRTETMIQTWIRAVEELLDASYVAAAQFIGAELPKDFGVDVFSDFAVTSGSTADLDTLLAMRMAGELTRLTFLKEVQRRGTLGPNVNVDSEAQEAEAEGPPIDPNAPIVDPNNPDDPSAAGGAGGAFGA